MIIIWFYVDGAVVARNVSLVEIFLLDYFLHCISFYRSIGYESSSREIFEEYITYLKEKAKEKERKREEEKVHNFVSFEF
jgi:hypothetical protein